jgi:hypothetical protein
MPGSTGHGNRYLARLLGQIAVTTARRNTFPKMDHVEIPAEPVAGARSPAQRQQTRP